MLYWSRYSSSKRYGSWPWRGLRGVIGHVTIERGARISTTSTTALVTMPNTATMSAIVERTCADNNCLVGIYEVVGNAAIVSRLTTLLFTFCTMPVKLSVTGHIGCSTLFQHFCPPATSDDHWLGPVRYMTISVHTISLQDFRQIWNLSHLGRTRLVRYITRSKHIGTYHFGTLTISVHDYLINVWSG